jgi:hypothetical protein
MVRTQLQIDEKTYDALRVAAHNKRKSMSAVVREILHDYLEDSAETRSRPLQTFTFVSSGSSGRRDISVRHDEALSEDFR